VDARVGGYPYAMAFTRNDGSGTKVPARLPASTGVRTWQPLAWSPSGRYLLVRPLPQTTEGDPPDPTRLPAPIVLDAQSGSEVTWAREVMPPADDDLRPTVAWDPQVDALYGVTLLQPSNTYGLRMVRSDGSVADVGVLRPDGTTAFESFPPMCAVSADDPGAPLFILTARDSGAAQGTWLLQGGKAVVAGQFEPTEYGLMRYSPAAGVFVTVYGGYDAPTTLEVRRPDGSTVAVIKEPD
jgi:hypothetical protein